MDEVSAFHKEQGLRLEHMELSAELCARVLPDLGRSLASQFVEDALVRLRVPLGHFYGRSLEQIMIMPLVSILIPAHNAQQWIQGTDIESALAQTWPKKEVIIVDDGSTDQTVVLAKRFASKAVGVVTQPNQGAAVARNTAFAMCQGDYIQWLDADDLLDPDKVEKPGAGDRQLSE